MIVEARQFEGFSIVVIFIFIKLLIISIRQNGLVYQTSLLWP